MTSVRGIHPRADQAGIDAVDERIDRMFKRSLAKGDELHGVGLKPNYTTVRVFYATDRSATTGRSL